MSRTAIRYWRALLLALGLAWLPSVAVIAAGDAGSLFTIQLFSRGGSTRITVGLVRPLSFHASVDAATGRLAVDFNSLNAMPGAATGRGGGLVRTYHAEPASGGGVRLVFDLSGPAAIKDVQALPAEPGKPPSAVIELAAVSATAMRQASGVIYRSAGEPVRTAAIVPSPRPAEPPPVLSKPAAPDRISALIAPDPAPVAQPVAAIPPPVSSPPRSRGKPANIATIIAPKRVIVIDAGHGGIDPGADSVAGYHEKEITLATARLLRRVLEETGRYKVVLTRDSDTYLKLHERVALARAAHGDLFISLHADSAAERMTRGASIYTLSETASDAESERYAQRENRADAIGGVDLGDQSDDVAGILVDLTVRETVNDGNRLAGMLANSLEQGGVALLPHAPHRAAGFAVLKSPDIPSVLIEMGYLSDLSDSRALADPRHQLQIARAVAQGVDRYFTWLAASRS